MQGKTDSPLTTKGIRMTENLAADISAKQMDVIYCSPLGRTLQTADILFGDQEIRIEDRLREIDLGTWEGRLQADLDIEDTEQHTNFWKNPDRFICPGGENFQEVSERSVDCLLELAARHEGESVALVSHTLIIRAMLFYIEQRPLADFWLPPAVYPASISELVVEDGTFTIRRFADISHYDPEDCPQGAY